MEHARDPEKPNFIFSSDVSSKASFLYRRYRRKIKGASAAPHHQPVELTSNATCFTFNVELNTLLSRNNNLRASDLVKDNLISLAKADGRRQPIDKLLTLNHHRKPRQTGGDGLHSSMSAPLTPSTTFHRHSTNTTTHTPSPSSSSSAMYIKPYSIRGQIFIVSLILKVLEFTVEVAPPGELLVEIDFLKDESYGILVLCDYGLIDQIEAYIRTKFLCEYTRGLTQDDATFSDGGKEYEYEEAIEGLDTEFHGLDVDISIDEDTYENNTSIDSPTINNLSTSSIDEKSFAYEQDDEYNSSIEELNLLKSNDITRSNTKEEDENDDDEDDDEIENHSRTDNHEKINNGVYEDEDTEDENVFYSRDPTIAEGILKSDNLRIIKEEEDSLDTEDNFLTEISNLRHNEHIAQHLRQAEDVQQDHVSLDDLNSLEHIDDVDCDLDEEGQDSPSRKKLNSYSKVKDAMNKFNQPYRPSLGPPLQLRRTSGNDTYVLPAPMPPPLPVPPQKRDSSNFVSPRKGREKDTLSRKTSATSFSLVNHDEDSAGLEYAFRDRSPTVPSYIKQNKKFKFIKVGKVQKFVNFFEERKPTAEELANGELSRQSSNGSLRPSMPSSPTKRATSA